MGSNYETSNGNGPVENGHSFLGNSPYQPCLRASLPWLDVRVFYVRVSKCKINDPTPEYLTLNHIPSSPNTLLEVNGVRTSIYSDGASSHLRRDRWDQKSEEATFVCTENIQMTGSVKFHVFDRKTILLSGSLELCSTNGFIRESENSQQHWSLTCESDIFSSSSYLKGKQKVISDLSSPTIEVYVAGSYLGTPIILTETLQLHSRKKQPRNGMLDSIPEYEAAEYSGNAMQLSRYSNISDNEDDRNLYSEDLYEGEDVELSWFNAGVRVGVGIGLSVCVGIGLGVGLIVRTYQGTTRNFRRRLL